MAPVGYVAPVKRSNRAVLVTALALLTVMLAYVGFQRLPGDLSVTDALYYSVSLFAFSYAGPESGTPWELDVARLMAAGIVTYAAVATVFLIARDQAQALRTRLTGRDHVIVVGSGTVASRLARAIHEDPDHARVIVIESDAAAATIEPLRAQGIPVVVGDPSDPEVGRTARIGKATDCCLVTGDDSMNLEALAALRRAAVDDGDPQVTFHVQIDDLGLWAELHRLPIGADASGITVEFVSLADRVSRTLLNNAARVVPGTDGSDHIVVAGAGAVAARIVSNGVRLCRARGNGVRVTLVGPQAKAVESMIRSLESWIPDEATVEVIDDLTPEIGAAEPATVGFVCDFEQRAAISLGASLSRCLAKCETPVYVATSSKEIARALEDAGIGLPRVQLVAAEQTALSSAFIEGSAIEVMARAKHASDLRTGLGAGVKPDDDPSLVPWARLDPQVRRAYRRFGSAVSNRLESLGAVLVPFSEAEPDKALRFTDDDVEEMARKRHEPSDVPDWDELTEDEKARSREEFRKVPDLLARGGYEIVAGDETT